MKGCLRNGHQPRDVAQVKQLVLRQLLGEILHQTKSRMPSLQTAALSPIGPSSHKRLHMAGRPVACCHHTRGNDSCRCKVRHQRRLLQGLLYLRRRGLKQNRRKRQRRRGSTPSDCGVCPILARCPKTPPRRQPRWQRNSRCSRPRSRTIYVPPLAGLG